MMEETYLQMLKQVEADCHGDPEIWHGTAEGIMLDFLKEAGFFKFAEEYSKQSKNWWYA